MRERARSSLPVKCPGASALSQSPQDSPQGGRQQCPTAQGPQRSLCRQGLWAQAEAGAVLHPHQGGPEFLSGTQCGCIIHLHTSLCLHTSQTGSSLPLQGSPPAHFFLKLSKGMAPRSCLPGVSQVSSLFPPVAFWLVRMGMNPRIFPFHLPHKMNFRPLHAPNLAERVSACASLGSVSCLGGRIHPRGSGWACDGSGALGRPLSDLACSGRGPGFAAGSGPISAHLVHCKADGLHVAAEAALSAAMFLHERQHEAAA